MYTCGTVRFLRGGVQKFLERWAQVINEIGKYIID